MKQCLRLRFGSILLVCLSMILGAGASEEIEHGAAFKALNSELGIVYRPTSIKWDNDQWNSIFRDPVPPMGWAVLPVGRESCTAITQNWISNVRRKGLRPAIVFTPFLTPTEMRRTIDCAFPLGVRRVVVDEYIQYQTKNNHRPLCAVLAEVRSLYSSVKSRYPSLEFLLNDSWHIWMVDLAKGQSACGPYPHFRVDMAGVSVLTKYGNPVAGGCNHPTAKEMEEQLIDLRPTVRDYSKTGRTFVWQLNQNWYPGGENVLQLFRRMKSVYGWERFFLFGPTTTHPTSENWGYNFQGGRENCGSSNYEWYLPARQYLVRVSEGRQTAISLQAPRNAVRGSAVSVNGRITAGSGIRIGGIEFQFIPPAGSPQNLRGQFTAPPGAFIAFVGMRVNSQLPNPIRGPAQFSAQRIQLFEAGSNNNLVNNGDFDDGLQGWVLSSNTPVNVNTNGSEKSLDVNASASQNVTLTSTPITVIPGRSYILNVDARLFRESRNSAYFFVGWNNPGELRRDRLFMKWSERHTLAAVTSRSDGRFNFTWQPTEPGTYQLFAFFKGTRAFQPAIGSVNVNVN